MTGQLSYLWRSILLLAVGTPLTFVSNEGSNNVTVLTDSRLSILLDIVVTLLTDGLDLLPFLLEFDPAVHTLDSPNRLSAVLAYLMCTRQVFKSVSSVASGTGGQHCLVHGLKS